MSNYTEIKPSDFSSNITDRFRHKWTADKLWWIVEASKAHPEARFIVTVDARTGCAHGNLTIEGIRQTPGYGTFQVLIKSHDFEDRGTWFRVDNLGSIVEVAPSVVEGGTKWTALDVQRQRKADNPHFETYEGIRVSDRERYARNMASTSDWMMPISKSDYADLHRDR